MFRAPLLPTGGRGRSCTAKNASAGGSSIAAGRYWSYPRKTPVRPVQDVDRIPGLDAVATQTFPKRLASVQRVNVDIHAINAVKYHCAAPPQARNFDGGGPRTKQAFRPLTQI